MDSNETPERESILSVARKWLPWCLALIFVLTIGWTGLIAYTEIANAEDRSVVDLLIAIVNSSAIAQPAIILYSFLIVTVLDTVGGFIVVTKRYLEEKWLKPQRERFSKEAREEGLEQGREQERQAWIAWNRRREEAVAQGLPFDEPPPGS